jgi:hypothetical protein
VTKNSKQIKLLWFPTEESFIFSTASTELTGGMSVVKNRKRENSNNKKQTTVKVSNSRDTVEVHT